MTLNRSKLGGYGVALVSILLLAFLELLVEPLVGTRSVFFLFFLGVIFSAWRGGLGPGLLATGTAACVGAFFFLNPPYSFPNEAGQVVRLALFILGGIAVSHLTAARRKAEEALLRAHHELEERVQDRTGQLQSAIKALETEITQRKQAEEALLKAREELEIRVQERTGELAKANEALRAEIQEREMAQAALHAQRTWLEELLNFAPSPILLVERNTARILFANRTAHAMADGEFPTGKSVERAHPEYYCMDAQGNRLSEAETPWARLARGERLDRLEVDWQTPSGKLSLLLFADTLPAMSGHPDTGIVVFQDVTSIKTIENELRTANRLKDEFLATVSHELRTPLNSILGWTRLMRAGQLDEAAKVRALEIIERNARLQVQLIDDILDVSRIITGKLRLDIRPVEIKSVIETAIDVVRPAADAKEIKLEWGGAPVVAPLLGDPDRLRQVVWNLLSNAIKFTPRGGCVKVHLKSTDSRVEIAVSDTGQGISLDFLPYVFDRFRQGDSTTKRSHFGLGLGLAIVRHLVELHGGTVHAHSQGEGQGTQMTVTMPVRMMDAVFGKAQEPPEFGGPLFDRPDGLAGLRVLVVDDEPDALDLVAAILSRCGVEVKTSASAREGLELVQQWLPNVLIADIGMPGEDGLELIRKIRALAPEKGGRISAVALTAYARPEDCHLALSAGYQIHMPKPVEPQHLVKSIASLAASQP